MSRFAAHLVMLGMLAGTAAAQAQSQPPSQAPRQVTCESVSDRYVECAIPENSHVKLLRTLSNSPCTLARTYGGDRTRIWVRNGCRGVFEVTPPPPPGSGGGQPEVSRSYLLRCESSRNGTSECPVDPSGTVKLATQRSGTACTEGQTWGRLGGSLYVTRGCRAEFEVTPTARPGSFQRPSNTSYWLTCESRDSRRFYCRIGEGDTPRVEQQMSRTSCVEGSTWGVSPGYLWVDDGCRAEFEVLKGRQTSP
jgi:hypothetical protein